MTIDPIALFSLLVALFVLSLALIILVIYLAKLMDQFHSYQKEQKELRNLIGQKDSQLLDEARNKAEKIVEEANNQALNIIKEANVFSTATTKKFDKELESANSGFLKLYNNSLINLISKNTEIFQNTSKDIEESVLSEINKFKEIVEQKTVESQDLVRKEIEGEYDEVKKDLVAYREKELKKVDDGIYQLLQRVTQIVLGKALPLSDQENLITESLEKAKQEGIFKQ